LNFHKEKHRWEGRSCNDFPVEERLVDFIIYGDKGSFDQSGADIIHSNEKNKVVKEVKPVKNAVPQILSCPWQS